MLFGYLIYILLIHLYIIFVFSLVLALIEGLFHYRYTEFYNVSKHLEVCQKYSAMHHIKHL